MDVLENEGESMTVTYGKKHWRALAFATVLVCSLLWAGAAPAADGSAQGGDASSGVEGNAPSAAPDALAQIWMSRSSDVEALVEEANTLHNNAENMAKPLAIQVRDIRSRFTRLSSLYQASRGHPTEQLTLVQQMHNLVQELRRGMLPLENIATTINSRLEEIGALQKSVRDTSGESHAGEDSALSEENRALQKYTRTLEQARSSLTPASYRLESILAPAKSTLINIQQSVAEIEDSLVGVWEDYYLTSSDNTLDALASTPTLLADWLTSLYSRMSFAYPQSIGEWLFVLKFFFVAACLMGGLGFLALRGAKQLPERWETAVSRVIRGAWVWVALGFSILAASTNQQGGIYFGFVLTGSLIIIAGVAALSWRLRLAVFPSLERQPSPLTRLYIPAAIGVLMLFSDLPTRILGIVWGVVMLAFVVKVHFVNKEHKEAGELPLLERLAYGSAFWFGIASLLVAVVGYARMAILLFMLLFAVVNTVILASALMALFDMLVDMGFSKTTKPVRNAVAKAAGIPVALIFSLLCTVPWMWAVPGARYLLDHFMSTDYKVGEATFDFSKLLIIGLLFFLFRSFISLANASLEHLPDRLPSMERGVIPPLRTLVTYGLWVVFGMISLGMLGVDFTSLAVVAGGLSVGIGFGMQTIFNNLISGLMLIFGRSILVGDYVEVNGAAGTVRAINIRATTIETPDRAVIYVPNSNIMSGQFTNWTRNGRLVRRSLTIGVAYGTDTELVQQLLLQAAKEQDHILQFPQAGVLFNDFGANSLDFTMNVFIDDFNNATDVMSQLRFRVERLFSEHGIDIPFPQLTLHMPDRGERLAVVTEATEQDASTNNEVGKQEKTVSMDKTPAANVSL